MHDNETIATDDTNVSVSNLLVATSTGLFVIFFATLVADILPIQILNPLWQVQFVARLFSSGIYALLGFCLLHLAVVVNPANHLIRVRLGNVRKLAIAVSIGYLLLIPLQGFATWRAFKDLNMAQQTQLNAANQRLAPIKKSINDATSVEDLQNRLRGLRLNINLEPTTVDKPLQELKKNLLSNIERTENQISDRLTVRKPQQIWSSAQAGVRTLFSSIGFALAFAAGAQARGSSETLLESLYHRYGQIGRSRRRKAHIPY